MPNEASGGGYKRPPLNTRFPKGRSGNPKGRPSKKAKSRADILNREISAEFDGELLNVPITEAAMMALFSRALKGDLSAARTFLRQWDKMGLGKAEPEPPPQVTRVILHPAICDELLLALGVVRKEEWDDPDLVSETDGVAYHMELWVLEEALRRCKPKSNIGLIARSTVDPDKAKEILNRAGLQSEP